MRNACEFEHNCILKWKCKGPMIKTTQRIPEMEEGREDNRTTEVTGVAIETGKNKKEEEKPAATEEKVERGHKAAADGAAGTG
jgi:hypothetical protein